MPRFPRSRRTIALIAATVVVAGIAAACAALPVPLPFQAAPAGEAKPGGGQEAGAPGKPGAQAKPGGGGGAGVPVVVTSATQGRIGQVYTFSGSVTPVQQTSLVPK